MNMFGNSTLMQTAPKVSEDGTGGTSDYNDLGNKPSIDGVTLEGNKTLDDLGIQEKVDGKGLSTNDYTNAEKTKLSGIAASANNYVHPSNHPASVITQDTNNRFVTDTEKSSWNNKADKSTTINGKSLTSNVTLTQDDIKNGSSFKQFGNEDKIKLDSIVIGTSGNINEDITAHNADVDAHPRLKDMVTLDGETKENFNFIGNNVVQDGLFHAKNYNGEKQTILGKKEFPLASEVFTIVQEFIANGTAPTNTNYNILCEFSTTPVYITIDKTGYFDNTNCVKNKSYSLKTPLNTSGKNYFAFTLDKKTGIFYLYVNGILNTIGEVLDTTKFGLYKPLFSSLAEATFMYSNRELYTVQIYNRQLTQQEIQHNLSVLNNAPSLSQLEVTDEQSNQTSILSLGSTGNHVEMSSGRTLEEEYMGVLEGMSQEYTSTGGAITVNDGLKARLVGAEIQGQTVKNYFDTFTSDNFASSLHSSVDNFTNIISINGTSSTNTCFLRYNNKIIEPNKTYNLVVFIYENTLDNSMTVSSNHNSEILTNQISIASKEIGIKSYTVKTKEDLTNCTYSFRPYVWSQCTTGTIKFNAILVDKDVLSVSSYIPFGLSSTVATISNNGIKYPFYASLEDKAQKKQILLPFPEDKFTLNEDGSGTLIEVNGSIELKGVQWTKANISVINGFVACFSSSQFVGDRTKVNSFTDGLNDCPRDLIATKYESVACYNEWLLCSSPQGITTLEGFLNWIKTKDVKTLFRTSATTTTIPKEVNSPILTTDKINIFSAGEAVKPSSFKVNVPVNTMAEMDKLKADMANVTALVNEMALK